MSYNKSFCKDIYLISDIKLNPKPPDHETATNAVSVFGFTSGSKLNYTKAFSLINSMKLSLMKIFRIV